MSTSILNYIENFNESFIFITGYFVFYFSEWTYDPIFFESYIEYQSIPELKYYIGYYYISALFIIFVANILLIFKEIKLNIRKAFRKRIYYNKWGKYYKIKIFNYAK